MPPKNLVLKSKDGHIQLGVGLLESGGSDFHGEAKPHIQLGVGRGNLCVPFEFYEALRAASYLGQ